MKKTLVYSILFFMATLLLASQECTAEFSLFQGRGKVEAEEGKEYVLSDSDGLWFVMAKTFIGDDARDQANQLALEFRKKYKLNAYIYKTDSNIDDLDELSAQRGQTRRYRYQTEPQEQYAVLVGSFPSSEDLNLQKTLLNVKRTKPDCLAKDPMSKMITIQFEQMAQRNKEFAGFGPLGGAIAVPNPLIDKEYFNQKGVVDSFIEKINSDSKYNLLNNPKMYTIRVATFGGASKTYKMGESSGELKSKLEEAGIKASALCTALREQGIDAWEFHDRDSSFVTIGGFDNYGYSRADGRTEIDPAIHQLIEKYRGQLTGKGSAYRAYTVTVELAAGGGPLAKKTRVDIPFDLQPVIILVPQRPGNQKRTVAAKKKLDQEVHHYEMQLIKQSLEADEAYDARNYGKNLSEGRELTEEEYKAMLVQEHQGQLGQPATGTLGMNGAVGVTTPRATTQNYPQSQNPQAQNPQPQGYPQAQGYPAQQTQGYPQAQSYPVQQPQNYQQAQNYPQAQNVPQQGYQQQGYPQQGYPQQAYQQQGYQQGYLPPPGGMQQRPAEQTATRPNAAPTY